MSTHISPVTMTSVMQPVRLKPSDLGCARPYTLSAKGKVFLEKEDAARVRSFAETYQECGRSLLDLIFGWWKTGGDSQVFAVLLICPLRVAPSIEKSELWQRAQATAKSVTGSEWADFADNRVYHFLRTMAGVEGRAAPGPKMIPKLLAESRPSMGLITAEKFSAIFEAFPSETWRVKLTAQVVGILRGFFSQAENARLENDKKRVELNRLRALHPEFFIEFERLLKAQAAWHRACRALRETRRHLIEHESVTASVVNACQIQATLERPDFLSWQPVVAQHSAASLAPILRQAWEHRSVVEKLLAAFPRSCEPDGIESDLTRRLSSGNRIREVAGDPYLATRLLELYRTHVEALPAEAFNELLKVERYGRKAVQVGWRAVMNAKPSSPLAQAKIFFVKQVAAFAEALRQTRTPLLQPQTIDLSPWLAEGDGWNLIEKRPGGIGNAIKAELRIPAVRAEPEQSMTAILRGNIAFAKGAALEDPLNVFDGILQFRPDQTVAVPGDYSRKTYLKPQGLRLTVKGDEIFAGISTRRMTESPRPLPNVQQKEMAFSDGERLAVLHLCPGGMRLGTLTLFEKRTGRWRMFPFRDVVRRSDAGAFDGHDDARRLVRNSKTKNFTHLHFDLNTLCLAIDAQLAKLSVTPTAPISFKDNQANIARVLPVKAALGATALQRIATRIGRILASQRVSHLLVAGSGQIISRAGASIPVRQFFALRSIGPRRIAMGYLAFATQKAGAGLTAISGRFSLVDSKGYDRNQPDAPIVVGVPFRYLKSDEEGYGPGLGRRTRRGTPEHLHLPSAPQRVADFHRNAAESLLIAWLDEDFQRRAQAVLQKTNLRLIELPSES